MKTFLPHGHPLYTLLMITFLLLCPGWIWAQARLENPEPASVQSGIGVISGWVCTASRVEIEFDGALTLQAAYGTSRADTAGPEFCGDDGNNGFGLLFNWNILGDGVHTVRALADGVEFARAAFLVTTLGLGEFPRGLSRALSIANFPQTGGSTRLQWQESQQNFVISRRSAGGGGSSSIDPTRFMLENPQPASFQSGIGVISGWVCTASRVEIEFDGALTLQAAYGTSRADTAGPEFCGDDGNNGFGLLFNWNILGDGVHTVRALADGVEFANVTFTVTTLGLGEFARGLSGNALVTDFPQAGASMRLQWQESQQNFLLSGALPAGVNANQCVTQAADATDAAGATASLSWSNPCLLAAGNTMLLTINNALTGATAVSVRAHHTAPRPFFACDTDLHFVQGNRIFNASQFDWLDAFGQRVCRRIEPGRSLETFIRVRPGVPLDFNKPFQALYVGRPVIDFPPVSPPSCQLVVSPTKLDFGVVIVGQNRDATFRVTNSGTGTLLGEASTIGLDADFHILAGGSFVLGEGQSQTVIVRFSPRQAGEQIGHVSVDSNCGSALVSLFGSGDEDYITSNGGLEEILVSGTVQ